MPSFDVKGFVTAWNTQSTDRILDYYADNAEMVVLPDTDPYRGKEGIRQNVQEVTSGIRDLNGDVAWSVQQQDKVAMLVHVSGRHAGEMVVSDKMRLPATGRDVRFTIGIFLELDQNGKIRRETDIADNLGLLQQVGAMERMMAQPTR